MVCQCTQDGRRPHKRPAVRPPILGRGCGSVGTATRNHPRAHHRATSTDSDLEDKQMLQKGGLRRPTSARRAIADRAREENNRGDVCWCGGLVLARAMMGGGGEAAVHAAPSEEMAFAFKVAIFIGDFFCRRERNGGGGGGFCAACVLRCRWRNNRDSPAAPVAGAIRGRRGLWPPAAQKSLFYCCWCCWFCCCGCRRKGRTRR